MGREAVRRKFAGCRYSAGERSDAMKTPSSKGVNKWTNKGTGVAAAAVALALGLAGNAFAQGSPGTVGGSETDMTSAGNTMGGGLPQIQQQGTVSYVSGGVGLDESQALKREAPHWPLSMSFIGPTADYLSEVHVRIVGAEGAEVLNAESRGPYMLVKLPPGKYTVLARYKDQEQKRAVTVSAQGSARADFRWSIQ
jgi:hypothetical protein